MENVHKTKKSKATKEVETEQVRIYHAIISYFTPEEKLFDEGDLEVEHEAYDDYAEYLDFLREDVYESLCDLEKKTEDPLIKSRLSAKQNHTDIVNEVNSHALNKSPHSRDGRSIVYDCFHEDIEVPKKKKKAPKKKKVE